MADEEDERRPTSATPVDPGRPLFEELDRRSTPQGDISLRRRFDPSLQVEVHEVRLDEDFLMSSLFTVAEEELAHLTLRTVAGDGPLDVEVGGLGLGCTARAALDDPRVRSVEVVEAAEAVIDWHRRGLVPLGAGLSSSERCRFLHADFFRRHAEPADGAEPPPVDVILLDVDHTPRNHLHPSHAALYEADGLERLRRRIRPGGAFGLWSDDPPDEPFLDLLRSVFASTDAHIVDFPNPYTGGTSSNTVYVARTSGP
jgi:spermidine synthase